MNCEQTSFMYPSLVDVFYPMIEQGAYGNVSKVWVVDRSVAGSFATAGSKVKQELIPNATITQDSSIIARVKSDVRIATDGTLNSLTNVVLTNIRDQYSNEIYLETAGPRVGKSTIFEIATFEPIVGPFGSVEFYSLILRRSENQAVDV